MFDDARSMLSTGLKDAAGVSVTYSRTGQTSLSLTVVPGRTVFASNQDGGARIEFGDRDYLIVASELTYGEPALGDRIAETIDSVTTTFEVQTPNTGEPAWRWSDPGHTRWRIHTKQVS
jgi:hypothetical protein